MKRQYWIAAAVVAVVGAIGAYWVADYNSTASECRRQMEREGHCVLVGVLKKP